MIQGAKYWDNREKCSRKQSNNAIETLVPGLSYCGPTAAAMAHDSLCDQFAEPNPYGGLWSIQKEDYSTAFFLGTGNWPMFQKIRALDFKIWAPNEIPQYYPYMAKMVFGMDAEYREDCTFENIAKQCWEGNACQICLIKPGHYLIAVAYDDATQEIIYNDPWPERFQNGDGFNRRLKKADFDNIQNWYILYHKE